MSGTPSAAPARIKARTNLRSVIALIEKRALGCESACGPGADPHAKVLITIRFEVKLWCLVTGRQLERRGTHFRDLLESTSTSDIVGLGDAGRP